jgi:putative ABC transport system substrate-binding protein
MKKILTAIAALVIIILGFSFFGNKPNKTNKSVKTVGVLQFVSHPALDEIYRGLKDGLKDNGYTEGKNLKIIFQNGQADQSKLQIMSEELINKHSDVLVGIATPAAQSLANTTSKTPIVLGAITDPVGAKLVNDETKPSGNVTGVSDKTPAAAQIDLISQLLPQTKVIGTLYSSGEDNSRFEIDQLKKVASKKGYVVKEYAVPSTNEINSTVAAMVKDVDLIYIPVDNTIASAMQTVVSVANANKKPIIPSVNTMVEQGGLAAVGINQHELGVKTGEMVAQILNGKKIEKLPVYSFKKGDIYLNEKQAKLLGVTIPDDLKKSAKEIYNKE